MNAPRLIPLATAFVLVGFALLDGPPVLGQEPEPEAGQAAAQTEAARLSPGDVAVVANTPDRTNLPRLRGGLAHTAYTRSMPQRLTVKVDFDTLDMAEAHRIQRPALNLALVIDRSGSMDSDRRFLHAIEAVSLVIENLTDRDTLSIIAFGDHAVVLSPAGRVVNKAFLRHRLSEVSPKGWTNLSGGILAAAAQIDSQDGIEGGAAAGALKKVIVLTDGEANRGIVEPGELRGLATVLHSRGISLSTIGVGTQFDGELLTALAEAGGGRYSYVKDPEGIPAAMERELQGFLHVLIQNAELAIRVGKGAQIVRVYGRLIERPTGEASFRLGDLREGEQGTFLIDVAPRQFELGDAVEVEVVLTGDLASGGVRYRKALSLTARYTESPVDVEVSANPVIALYSDVLGALEDAEEALMALDMARAEKAVTLFEIHYERARALAHENRDQQMLNQTFLLKHFMSELAEAVQSGEMHDHDEAAEQLGRGVGYRRYLMEHHRIRK